MDDSFQKTKYSAADAELLEWILAHPEEASKGLYDASIGFGKARENLEDRAGLGLRPVISPMSKWPFDGK